MKKEKKYEIITLYFAYSNADDMRLLNKINESNCISATKSGMIKQVLYDKFIKFLR